MIWRPLGRTGKYARNFMHRWSKLFVPTLREAPSDAEVASHKFLLRSGYIRQLGAGIYNYLPLGQRSFNKIIAIVREEMDKIGQEFFLPAILPKTQFGQFTSAVSLTQSVFVIVSNYAVGFVVDRTGSYKVIYWWSAVLTAISLVLWLVLYRDWVRLGGSHHYVAPVYEDMRGENAVE